MCRCTPGRNLLDSGSILICTDSVTLLLSTIPVVYIKVGALEGGGKVVVEGLINTLMKTTTPHFIFWNIWL